MRKLFLRVIFAGLCWAATGWVQAADTSQLAMETGPVITWIRREGTNLVVAANVPAGVTKVTLESCRRLGGEAWTPKAVGRLDGAGGELTFRLALSADLALLRVRADAREALPDFFYRGPSSFDGRPVSSAGGGPAVPGGVNSTAWGGSVVALNGNLSPSGTEAQLARARAVTESDIWEISGDTLYFFNQYRGLQVIDIGRPDSPVVLGTLPVAAAGEQM